MKKLIAMLSLMIAFSITSNNLFPFTFSTEVNTTITAQFTSIPGGRLASYNSRYELRVGFKNPDSESKTARIYWRIDEENAGMSTAIISSTDEYKLVKTMFNPNESTTEGAHTVGAIVMIDGVLIAEEYRLVEFVDSGNASIDIATTAFIEPALYMAGVYPANRNATQQDVIDDINEMHALGIDTLVIAYTEYNLINCGPFYEDSQISALLDVTVPDPIPGFDFMDTVLSQAEINGQDVYIGPGRGDTLNIPVGAYANTTVYNNSIDLLNLQMNELYEKFGHYKSFYGWYTAHEASDYSAGGGKEIDWFDDSIRDVKKNYPELPIITGPSGAPPIMNTTRIEQSFIDVFSVQDAVGAGYDGSSYTYNSANALVRLDNLFSGCKAVIDTTTKHLWSDTEVWEMDGTSTAPNHYGNPYSASFTRVAQQISTEKKYVSVLGMYAYSGYLGNPSGTYEQGDSAVNITKSEDLYSDYTSYANSYMQQNGISDVTVSAQTEAVTTGKTKSEYLASLPKLKRAYLSNNISIKSEYLVDVTDISSTQFAVAYTTENASILVDLFLTETVTIQNGYTDPPYEDDFVLPYDTGYVEAENMTNGGLKIVQSFSNYNSTSWSYPSGFGTTYSFDIADSGAGQDGAYGIYQSSANTIHPLQYNMNVESSSVRDFTGATEMWMWVDYTNSNGTLFGMTLIDGDNSWFQSGNCLVYTNNEWSNITKAFNGGVYLPSSYKGFVRFPLSSFTYAFGGNSSLELNNVSSIQLNVSQSTSGINILDTLSFYDPNVNPEPPEENPESDPYLNPSNRTSLIDFENVLNYTFFGASAAKLTGITGAIADTSSYCYDPDNVVNHFLYSANYSAGESGKYLVYTPYDDSLYGVVNFLLYPSSFGSTSNFSTKSELMIWVDTNDLNSTYLSLGLWEQDSGGSELWQAGVYLYQESNGWTMTNGSQIVLPSGYKGFVRVPFNSFSVSPYFTIDGIFQKTNIINISFGLACNSSMSGQSAFIDTICLY